MKTDSILFRVYEKYMYFIGLAGQLIFYIQAYEIFALKDAGNVSLAAFTFGFLSVSSWLIYGLFLKNRVLVVANTFAVIGAGLAITGILLYGEAKFFNLF